MNWKGQGLVPIPEVFKVQNKWVNKCIKEGKKWLGELFAEKRSTQGTAS